MKWINKQEKEFEKDELRREISRENWRYHKPRIKKSLREIAVSAKQSNIELSVYDYKSNPNGFGFDGLNLQFGMRFAGNMIQTETEEVIKLETEEGVQESKDKRLHYNHHMQEGAVLVITYSAVGHIHIFCSPSTSEDSLAKHKNLILYHTYDARTISDRVIKRCVKALFYYHRFTGVLHRITWRDRWAVRWLKTKMYFIEYLEPNEKFTRYSGLYIPIISFIVAVLSLWVAYLSYTPHQ
ncbi:hypothetical protein CBF17_024140 [Pantoea agglomerans]|uniref:hypothetical protein n=1 Tax=Enterobacter agglomerans TaxID=549 RepID=UPI000C086EFB|nr:hypothetical protein [Pantoea agglomerans]PHP91284.1 hypothetical protein CBF17_024140 [Pantoea agglomerans]